MWCCMRQPRVALTVVGAKDKGSQPGGTMAVVCVLVLILNERLLDVAAAGLPRVGHLGQQSQLLIS